MPRLLPAPLPSFHSIFAPFRPQSRKALSSNLKQNLSPRDSGLWAALEAALAAPASGSVVPIPPEKEQPWGFSWELLLWLEGWGWDEPTWTGMSPPGAGMSPPCCSSSLWPRVWGSPGKAFSSPPEFSCFSPAAAGCCHHSGTILGGPVVPWLMWQPEPPCTSHSQRWWQLLGPLWDGVMDQNVKAHPCPRLLGAPQLPERVGVGKNWN